MFYRTGGSAILKARQAKFKCRFYVFPSVTKPSHILIYWLYKYSIRLYTFVLCITLTNFDIIGSTSSKCIAIDLATLSNK